MRLSIGVDIGGTNTKIVIIDEEGNIQYCYERRTDCYGLDYLKNINEMIENALSSTDKYIEGIGIGVPGVVDANSGIVLISTALGWKEFDLKGYLEEQFSIPVKVENDVNAWSIAEKMIGAGKNSENFVMITIGTGIGAGLYINNKLYRGTNFQAGEIGYFPLGLDAYKQHSDFEDFGYFEKKASTRGTTNNYKRRTNLDVSCKEVFKLAKEGQSEAIEVSEEVYKYLGLGISTIICLLNPEKIIIGGGMSKVGEYFINNIKDKIEKLTPVKTTLQLSETGEFGGAIGSGLIVLNKFWEV